ncbi:DUF418 domain-containing protein [Frigoriglobus tundricola]|uniref:DUF418 domain-containing protein n=1 Tax=Frigoriglobus tundricola TaxID=2774151 RepID=A0A6M5Z2T7_9BACT|nr:DUF418 domain-containing protein [Frigoriglobus tundricola]QJX00740.1 hypothetical protein FTUN_8372 [Frigoriglobus tundricola]
MPTPSADPERIGALDLIRGTAILGILLANIPWFSGTGPTSLMGTGAPEPTFPDQFVKALTLVFVDGKFVTQLAVLFGAGLALQADRSWTAGRSFTFGYLWRTFLLFLIGAAHGLLLWFGDVLMIYACVSVAAVVFVRLRPTRLLTVAGAGLTASVAALATMTALTLGSGRAANEDKDKDKPPPGSVATPASLSRVVTDAFNAPADESAAREKLVTREFQVYFSRDNQIRIYREGTYVEQLFDRALNCAFLLAAMLFTAGELLACFLFGATLVRCGFFSDPDVYSRWRPWLLAGGLLIGVPAEVEALILSFNGERDNMAAGPQLFGAMAVATVYLTLLTGWAQGQRALWLQNRLKAVGRLALSNYLSQTVICTTVFYSFGLGLYATMGRPATLLVVLGVWALQLLISPLYLRFFAIGPVEWVWRSLAQRRPLPLRRRQTVRLIPEEGVVVGAGSDPSSPTAASAKMGDPESTPAAR